MPIIIQHQNVALPMLAELSSGLADSFVRQSREKRQMDQAIELDQARQRTHTDERLRYDEQKDLIDENAMRRRRGSIGELLGMLPQSVRNDDLAVAGLIAGAGGVKPASGWEKNLETRDAVRRETAGQLTPDERTRRDRAYEYGQNLDEMRAMRQPLVGAQAENTRAKTEKTRADMDLNVRRADAQDADLDSRIETRQAQVRQGDERNAIARTRAEAAKAGSKGGRGPTTGGRAATESERTAGALALTGDPTLLSQIMAKGSAKRAHVSETGLMGQVTNALLALPDDPLVPLSQVRRRITQLETAGAVPAAVTEIMRQRAVAREHDEFMGLAPADQGRYQAERFGRVQEAVDAAVKKAVGTAGALTPEQKQQLWVKTTREALREQMVDEQAYLQYLSQMQGGGMR